MLRFLKQRLDCWAINFAAKALPHGEHDPARLVAAAKLLDTEELLNVPDTNANLAEPRAQEFTFRSSLRSGLPRNDLVHGKIFRATDQWNRKPLVILVHGWNAELHYLYILPKVARALTRRGINAALIELPLHLQRRPPRNCSAVHDFISDDLETMLRATRQALADFHALAGWAREQGCPHVALWGFSLGAWLAGLYISQTQRVSHAILTTPIIDLARAVRELSFCHPIRAALGQAELDLSVLNLTSHRPRIPAERVHVCQCAYDLFVPAESYRHLMTAWNLDGVEVCCQSHLTVLVSRKSMRGALDWIARQFAAATVPSPDLPRARSAV